MILKKQQIAWSLFLVLTSTVLFTSCTDHPTTTSSNSKKQVSNNMKSVLIIGMNPLTMDFTNPEIPQGLSAQIIEKGLNETIEKLITMGYDAQIFLIDNGDTNLDKLAQQLSKANYDGVVIGNGIRGLKSNFILFEQLINVVHVSAPKSTIIFNSLPTDTDEAVKRWIMP
ncbi:MAG: hypothetical protein V4613_02735 [Bacteroidota bacterium]